MKRSVAALILCLVVLVAARPQCDERTFWGTCHTPDGDVTVVEPGTCADITIPCDNDWHVLGTFALRDTLEGLWVEIERRPTGNAVRVCVDETVPALYEDEFEYLYVTADGLVVDGIIRLTTGTPLGAQASADPGVVTLGGTSQLGVTASGGRPPYSYQWSFSESFQGPYDIADPVVKPDRGEIFGVQVIDAADNRVTASVLVDVVPLMNVIVSADTIDAGESVGLFFGTSVPFTDGTLRGWTWDPPLASGSPVDPGATSTSATPEVTTTYTFSIRTFYGTDASKSATVTVRP